MLVIVFITCGESFYLTYILYLDRVGKGIVYDSGGVALKSADSLRGMKRDLGGAAAVLGAFQAAVRSHCRWKIYAVLCVAENQISHTATRIDDIEVAYSGRTVEINNTDAEVRMPHKLL
jgi:probable aminopeptidase NPEPL1